MYKLIKNLAFAGVLALSLAFAVDAQTEKQVVVNSDGSYSVIEYPVDKEVMINLMPMNGISSTGKARVMRTANGTKVYFDVAQAPDDWKNVYAYAVDPMGMSTYLGPITFNGGVGKAEFTTPGNQFMLVLSPNEGMTTYDPSTGYLFRSGVPTGYAIVPRATVMPTTTTGAPTAVVSTSTVTTGNLATYDVPMLGISKYGKDRTMFRLKFDGEMSGLEAKAYLKPVGGKTQIRMNFDDLQKAPMNKRFVLWTASPEGYTKIGQVIHVGQKDTAQIRGETALNDFGLFLTVEDIDVDRPTSTIYRTFTYSKP